MGLMSWLFYGFLGVMVIAAIRGCYLLGERTQERDTYEWCNRQLDEQLQEFKRKNDMLKAQNQRLIDFGNAQEMVKEPESWGNIFPTE